MKGGPGESLGGQRRGEARPANGRGGGELSRRAFLAAAGMGVGSVTALLALLESIDVEAARAQALGDATGILDVRATIEAYADTIVPGPAGGADRHPGAIEAGAVDEAFDPFYGASAVFGPLHADLQAATPLILRQPARFDLDLPYADRERVVRERIESLADGSDSPLYLVYVAIAILIWNAYHGVARSELGLDYIGMPPRSDGYWPHHSHRVGFEGMTEDGNPP